MYLFISNVKIKRYRALLVCHAGGEIEQRLRLTTVIALCKHELGNFVSRICKATRAKGRTRLTSDNAVLTYSCG